MAAVHVRLTGNLSMQNRFPPFGFSSRIPISPSAPLWRIVPATSAAVDVHIAIAFFPSDHTKWRKNLKIIIK
jgi:hypothetical protein